MDAVPRMHRCKPNPPSFQNEEKNNPPQTPSSDLTTPENNNRWWRRRKEEKEEEGEKKKAKDMEKVYSMRVPGHEGNLVISMRPVVG